MKTLVTVLYAVAGILITSTKLQGQTYTLNWGSSFSSGWSDGQTNRNASNIGGSGINCNVQLNRSGGVFTNVYDTYGGAMTPTVSGTVYTIPGSSNNLLVALEYANNTNYCDITFTFSGDVRNLSFRLGDIDRLTNTTNNYFDQIIITGRLNSLNVVPTLTKYDNTTDPSFFFIAGNTATVNTAMNMSGNSATDASDQRGTINVSFGAQTLNVVNIRYQNAPGTMADPTVQNITIGNVSFQRAYPVPVQLLTFDGLAKGNKVSLNWKTTNEVGFNYFAIERSADGRSFTEIGRVYSQNNTNEIKQYSFDDVTITGGRFQYRLKMIDLDGTFVYSKVIVVNTSNTSASHEKVFPTIFTNHLSLEINAIASETVHVKLLNLHGQILQQDSYQCRSGNNAFTITPETALPPGQYFLVVSNREKTTTHKVIRK